MTDILSGTAFEDLETRRRFIFDALDKPRADGVTMVRGWWTYFDDHHQKDVRNAGSVRLDLIGTRFQRVAD